MRPPVAFVASHFGVLDIDKIVLAYFHRVNLILWLWVDGYDIYGC